MTPLLDVQDLSVTAGSTRGPISIVESVSFSLVPGRVLGIAGESGSGKTMSTLALLGLTPVNTIVTGSAMFGQRDLLKLSHRSMRDVRGRDIAMVFQDPMTSLHPMLTIGRQLTEHQYRHLNVSRRDAKERAIELLNEMRIPNPVAAMQAYPHHFSGGMRQRIAIAIALACRPRLLIADEPTTALDVTVQAGILRLLDRLRTNLKLSIILITHDLGVMSAIADDLIIFYAGRVIESGRRADILRLPRHPYTHGLLRALPDSEASSDNKLMPISGSTPAPGHRPAGCAFHPRCAYRMPRCSIDVPQLVEIRSKELHLVACPVDPLVQSS